MGWISNHQLFGRIPIFFHKNSQLNVGQAKTLWKISPGEVLHVCEVLTWRISCTSSPRKHGGGRGPASAVAIASPGLSHKLPRSPSAVVYHEGQGDPPTVSASDSSCSRSASRVPFASSGFPWGISVAGTVKGFQLGLVSGASRMSCDAVSFDSYSWGWVGWPARVRTGCCVAVEEETHEAPKDEAEVQVGVTRSCLLSRGAASTGVYDWDFCYRGVYPVILTRSVSSLAISVMGA